MKVRNKNDVKNFLAVSAHFWMLVVVRFSKVKELKSLGNHFKKIKENKILALAKERFFAKRIKLKEACLKNFFSIFKLKILKK